MKRMLAVLMLFALCACLLVGCSEANVNEGNSDFVFIEQEGLFEYVYHKDTGVIYVMYFCCNQAAMTVMLNPDGTPMIWEGESCMEWGVKNDR
jgi:hypothetical protein